MTRWMNLTEAAAHMRMDRTTLRRLIIDHGIPHTKVGARYVINRDQLDRAVESICKQEVA